MDRVRVIWISLFWPDRVLSSKADAVELIGMNCRVQGAHPVADTSPVTKRWRKPIRKSFLLVGPVVEKGADGWSLSLGRHHHRYGPVLCLRRHAPHSTLCPPPTHSIQHTCPNLSRSLPFFDDLLDFDCTILYSFDCVSFYLSDRKKKSSELLLTRSWTDGAAAVIITSTPVRLTVV